MKTQHFLFGLISTMALANVATAEDVNFGKKTPSATQVIEALKPVEANADLEAVDSDYEGDIKQNGKTRSIDMSNLDATPKVNKKKIKKSITAAVHKESTAPAALSMEILFGYKSAELTEQAKTQLAPVGEALNSETLQNLKFVVEGHTDAVGGHAYNQNLSKERADAVKQFLVDTFHINASRIQIIGKGKNELLDPKNPDSEVNRRVRIVATK